MNERRLDLGLEAIRAERTTYPDAADVRRSVLAIALEEIPRRRSWLERLDRRSFEPLVSATRLGLAAVIAMLLGGVLLTGLLVTSDDEQAFVGASPSDAAITQRSGEPTEARTSVRSDLVSGVDLEVEELQPGVFRVVSDGHRELRWVPGMAYWVTPSAITVAPDGSVWSFTLPKYTGEACMVEPGETGCMVFYRLGSAETHEMLDQWLLDDGAIMAGRDPVAVAPDGTIWAIVRRSHARAKAGDPELRSFDGEAWTVRKKVTRGGSIDDMAFARDGSVWALWQGSSGRPRLGRLLDGVWSSAVLPRGDRAALVTGAEGDVFLFLEDDGSLHQLEDLARRRIVAKTNVGSTWAAPHEGGGVYWWWDTADGQPGELVRFGGIDVARFEAPAGSKIGGLAAVGIDGAAWVAGQIDSTCDGIGRFDGNEMQPFLAGTCPTSVDIAPDGSVWLQATSQSQRDPYVDTFVITPHAWTADE